MGLEGQEPNSRGPLKAQLRDVAGVGGDQVTSRQRNGVRAAVGCLRPEGLLGDAADGCLMFVISL